MSPFQFNKGQRGSKRTETHLNDSLFIGSNMNCIFLLHYILHDNKHIEIPQRGKIPFHGFVKKQQARFPQHKNKYRLQNQKAFPSIMCI